MATATATIELDDWLRAVDLHQPVGNCSECLGLLIPQAPEKVGAKVWYTAVCMSCRREVVSPNGKVAEKHGPVERVDTIKVPPIQRDRDFRERQAGERD